VYWCGSAGEGWYPNAGWSTTYFLLLITSILKKEKLPEEWKESIMILIHKKGDKTDCNSYRGISLLPTTYKILSNILLSRLIPCAKEIIGDHQ
jgi:hypothetical protein